MHTENHHGSHLPDTLGDNLQCHTGISASKCYQCGKCSAGCPLSSDMDYPPSMIMRMLQTKLPAHEEKILKSLSIWLCLTCETCYTRCPMEIDIPKAMDYLRTESLKAHKAHKKASDIISFHRAFLDSVRYTGRLYEVGMISDYKTRTLHLLQDVLLAPLLFVKGKLHLFPELVKDRSILKKIFRKTMNS